MGDIHIVVVDDEAEIRDMIRDYLTANGFAVSTRRLGRGDARQRLAAEHPSYDRRLIFVTGDLVNLSASKDGIDGCAVIEKPFYASRVLSELARVATVNAGPAE